MKARKITLLQLIPLFLLLMQGSIFANTDAKKLNSKFYAEAAADGFTQQPVSKMVCPGASVTFSISYNGPFILSYQWLKNGVQLSNSANVSGANNPTLIINPTTAADNAAYRCVITHAGGIATSEEAWLNSRIISISGNTTCLNTPSTIEATADGNNPKYQWYKANGNSNVNGTAISGANNAVYAPPTDVVGTTYYYLVTNPSDLGCAKTTSSPVAFTVTTNANAGNVSENVAICPGTTGTVSISNYAGTVIQWQQSVSGVVGWADVTQGTGGTTASYTTPVLEDTMYYRAIVSGTLCGTAISDVVSVTPVTTFEWTGATDSKWAVATNWSCGQVPTFQNDVIIPSGTVNKPIVYAGLASAKSINVQNGTSLTIATGGTLQLLNTIFVEDGGKMTVENNGALIQINNVYNNGEIAVHRNSNSLYRLDYTIWSSPVSNQNLSDFSPLTSTNRFYEYKYDVNSNNAAIEGYWPVDPATTYFSAAKGFLIRMPNSNAATGYNTGESAIVHGGVFTGTPFNGPVTIAASTQANRYTAVGNPYASPISVEDFFTANNGVLESGSAIYLWRKRNNANVSSYATITRAAFTANEATNAAGNNTEGYASGGQDQAGYFSGNSNQWLISQGQGFIVKAAGNLSAPQITFNNSMRRAVPTAGGQAFFKQSQQQAVSRLWINLSNTANAFSQAAVAYLDGATTGLDYGYDGKTFTEGSNIAIYTLAGSDNLSVQARPAFENSDIVPVGYVATTTGSYTISLDRSEGIFAGGQDILLKDKANGLIHNLSRNDYTFTTEGGTFNDRFEILYTTTALGTDANELAANNVIVYKQGNAINITSDTAMISGVTVYDIRGRQLYASTNVNANETSVNSLQADNQVIIVEVNTEKGKSTKKIVL